MAGLLEDTELETTASTNSGLCPQYHIIFLNDDYHSFQFVIYVMVTLFRKEFEQAFELTKMIHETGQAIVTTCPKERAELYLEQVSSMKEGDKGAIGCVMEPAE